VRLLLPLGLTACCFLLPFHAQADLFDLTTQELEYALLGTGNTNITFSGTPTGSPTVDTVSEFDGNVGVASGGSVNIPGTGNGTTITGGIYFQDSTSPPALSIDPTATPTIVGPIQEGVAEVGTATSQLEALSAQLDTLTATPGGPADLTLTTGNTVDLEPGVYDVDNIIVPLGASITLDGTGQYVFNVTGSFDVDGGSISYAGSLFDNVVFNVLGSGTDITVDDGTVTGALLGLNRSFDMASPLGTGSLYGSIWGGTDGSIDLSDSFTLTAPTPVPEPGSWVLFATVLVTLATVARRRLA
jgi:hypothetical protein